MKKIIISCSIIYIVLLVVISVININKNNYYNYKKILGETVQTKDDLNKKDTEKVVIKEEKNNVKNEQNKKNEDKPSPIQFTRILKMGDRGEDVKQLQTILLQKKYFNGDITGLYGNQTTNAVKKFQQEANIVPANGILDENTIKEIIK